LIFDWNNREIRGIREKFGEALRLNQDFRGSGVIEFLSGKKIEPRIASGELGWLVIGSGVSIGRQPSNQSRICSALTSFQEKNNFLWRP
jgi:hypothetical protein